VQDKPPSPFHSAARQSPVGDDPAHRSDVDDATALTAANRRFAPNLAPMKQLVKSRSTNRYDSTSMGMFSWRPPTLST
jgi:hypothetical protein